MKLLLTTFLFLSLLHARAQHPPGKDTAKEVTFTKVEIEADYPGGERAWMQYLNHNLHYPDDAISNEIKGKVIVQFVVDTNGVVSDIKAISGPTRGGLREEAVRVIKASGNWIPATQNDVKVRSYKKIPIEFKLTVS